MKKSDAMKILRRNLEEDKTNMGKSDGSYKAWLEGRISGMESALFFLGEKQAVTDMKRWEKEDEAKRKLREEIATKNRTDTRDPSNSKE